MSNDTKKGEKTPATPEADPLVGTVLGGRYRIDTLLGRGSMGRVYAAEHVLMHKQLAVKVLNAEHLRSPEIVARFEREATAAANIDHPNVVAATDFGKLEDGTVYLALELVQGNNLRAEIARGPLAVRRALRIARQVAAALVAAHARNIVHRDLKPENVVLVEKAGDPDFVKVLDFGIARLIDRSGKSPLTKVGVVLGTLDYMAPEQALGQDVDGRADIYALGVVTYEMLCGACPYEGESPSAILGLQLTKPPPSLRERAPTLAIPGAVEGLVMKLLAKDRKDRPPSAAAVVAELDKLIASSTGGAAAVTPPAPAEKRPPTAPIVNKPTFLPGDALPAFTFPPVEEASKNLAADVKRALASKGPPSPPSKGPPSKGPPSKGPPSKGPPPPPVRSRPPPAREAPVAAPTETAVAPPTETAVARPTETAVAGPTESKPLPEVNASVTQARSVPAAERVRVFRERAALALEASLVWIDDHRRVLPRFIKRPLRRVPTGAILIGLVALVVILISTILVLATGGDGDSATPPARNSSVPP